MDRLKIATFNINGIRARLPNLLEWLEREQPDVVCLQELKAQDADFPIDDIRGLPKGNALGLAVWPLDEGFVADGQATGPLAVISEQDVLGDRLIRGAKKRRRADNFLRDTQSLTPGDLVVHVEHGIGRYTGLETIKALGVPDDLAERFWKVASHNITKLDDLAGWWAIFNEGATPDIAPEDAEFVAQAMTLLPPPPYTDATWGEWTTAVKEATGRKGKGLFMPLRKALTGMDHGPEMGELMPLLQRVPAAER